MKKLLFPALFSLLAQLPALAQTSPEVRTVADFHAVEVSSGIDLRLTPGTTQRVEASADTPEHLADLKTEVRDGVLKISYDWGLKDLRGMKNTRHLHVNVTATSLTALRASSGSRAEVVGAFTSPNMQVEVSSGATLKADFSATDMRAR